MKRENILAHRGRWATSSERNGADALIGAVSDGFGIETDLRDTLGDIFVSHDPVSSENCLRLRKLFRDEAFHTGTGRLALNIKADGLQATIRSVLEEVGISIDRVYAFDMSLPDMLGYLKTGIPVYTRASEYESDPTLLEQAAGVWVDNFSGDFPQLEVAQKYLEDGLRVAIVSPELHGREPDDLWYRIEAGGLQENPNFEICTDFPDRVSEILGAG